MCNTGSIGGHFFLQFIKLTTWGETRRKALLRGWRCDRVVRFVLALLEAGQDEIPMGPWTGVGGVDLFGARYLAPGGWREGNLSLHPATPAIERGMAVVPALPDEGENREAACRDGARLPAAGPGVVRFGSRCARLPGKLHLDVLPANFWLQGVDASGIGLAKLDAVPFDGVQVFVVDDHVIGEIRRFTADQNPVRHVHRDAPRRDRCHDDAPFGDFLFSMQVVEDVMAALVSRVWRGAFDALGQAGEGQTAQYEEAGFAHDGDGRLSWRESTLRQLPERRGPGGEERRLRPVDAQRKEVLAARDIARDA